MSPVVGLKIYKCPQSSAITTPPHIHTYTLVVSYTLTQNIVTSINSDSCSDVGQTVCVCDGGGQHHLDPDGPEHAGWSAVHLHPGHRRLPGPAHSRCLPARRAVETWQRTGTARFFCNSLLLVDHTMYFSFFFAFSH